MKKMKISNFNKLNSCSIISKDDLRFYKNNETSRLRNTKRAHLFDNLEVELAVASRMGWLDITR
jgi:hypothetical protein